MIISNRRRLASCAAAALIFGSAVVTIMAQGVDVTGPGSLAAVAAEIRQLRVAVEESTRTQTQTHALGVSLSAQQSRLAQVAARLDVTRRELDRLTAESRQVAAEVTNNEDEMQTAKPEHRSQLQMSVKFLQQHAEKLAGQLQQAQARELEAAQLLQAEEARWADLVGRMEALIKR